MLRLSWLNKMNLPDLFRPFASFFDKSHLTSKCVFESNDPEMFFRCRDDINFWFGTEHCPFSISSSNDCTCRFRACFAGRLCSHTANFDGKQLLRLSSEIFPGKGTLWWLLIQGCRSSSSALGLFCGFLMKQRRRKS